jgi:hypothetical protein
MFTQIGPINTYVVSNVSYRPVRTLLSVLAIAVEVTMILTLVGLSYGTLDATARRTRGVGADIIIRRPGSSIIGLSTAVGRARARDPALEMAADHNGLMLENGRRVRVPCERSDGPRNVDDASRRCVPDAICRGCDGALIRDVGVGGRAGILSNTLRGRLLVLDVARPDEHDEAVGPRGPS